MIGGMKIPPTDAQLSIAAEKSAGYPCFFIMGMVMTPVVEALAMALPDTIPNMADISTAIFATPPLPEPDILDTKVKRKSPAPEFSKKVPKIMNIIIWLEAMPSVLPHIPSDVRKSPSTIFLKEKPIWPNLPGMPSPA
jgi:hypothetical protein